MVKCKWSYEKNAPSQSLFSHLAKNSQVCMRESVVRVYKSLECKTMTSSCIQLLLWQHSLQVTHQEAPVSSVSSAICLCNTPSVFRLVDIWMSRSWMKAKQDVILRVLNNWSDPCNGSSGCTEDNYLSRHKVKGVVNSSQGKNVITEKKVHECVCSYT